MDQVLTRASIVMHVVSAQPLQDQTRLYYAISGGTSQLYAKSGYDEDSDGQSLRVVCAMRNTASLCILDYVQRTRNYLNAVVGWSG